MGSACSNSQKSRSWYRHEQAVGDLAGLVARHPLVLVNASLAGLKQPMLDDGCLSAIVAFAAGLVAEEPVMTVPVAEFVDT